MIGISQSGSFKNTMSFLAKASRTGLYSDLDRYGKMGVDALARATPLESGATANAWGYRIFRSRSTTGIEWYNSNENEGANVAILLQYGHGTGTGGYVSGQDYINPAIRPIFDRIADDIWKKVTNG